MAEKSKSHQSTHDLEQAFDVSVNDLESTLQNFMEEDDESLKKKENLLNPITMIGLAILAVSGLNVVQRFFPNPIDLDGLFALIIVIGGFLMLLTGLGTFTRPKRKKKRPMNSVSSVKNNLRGSDDYAFERKKKLFKSRVNRRIDGVCGGIADYLGMDATMVRILFVIFTFIGSGSPILVYFALTVILPKAPKSLEP